MRFRITSIADEDASAVLGNVLPDLEDWLNAALGDGDFGGSLDSLMVVVLATSFVPSSEKPVAPSRISTYADPQSGGKIQSLALHVPVDPELLVETMPNAYHQVVSKKLITGLPSKLLRTPKGLDYPRVRAAMVASLSVYTKCEAQPFAPADRLRRPLS